MSLYPTWWWLWAVLIALYLLGVYVGMVTTVFGVVRWWHRPAVLVWPAFVLAMIAWHAGRFLIGRE